MISRSPIPLVEIAFQQTPHRLPPKGPKTGSTARRFWRVRQVSLTKDDPTWRGKLASLKDWNSAQVVWQAKIFCTTFGSTNSASRWHLCDQNAIASNSTLLSKIIVPVSESDHAQFIGSSHHYAILWHVLVSQESFWWCLILSDFWPAQRAFNTELGVTVGILIC